MSVHPQIDEQITFFYTHNLNASREFYEEKLGLELWLDQGTCRIYTVSGSGYLGLCQTSEISTPPADKQSSVIFTLVTQQVDEWFEYLKVLFANCAITIVIIFKVSIFYLSVH